MQKPHGGVCDEGSVPQGGAGGGSAYCVRRHQHRGDREPGLSAGRRKLAEHQISCAGKTARQLRREDYQEYDFLVGMDHANLCNMRRMLGGDPEGKLSLLLDHAGRSGEEIADPWYTGDFEETYRDVLAGCQGLLDQIQGTHHL